MTLAKRVKIAALGLLSITGTATWAQEGSVALEEIIVTAEKREADLQKTAIAITALSADALTEAGVSQPEDLNKLVPGLGIAQGGPSTQVYVRGVGNYGTNAFADPAVAFNMDGIYISRFSGISGNFYDIARVEVLKGPQGTLYGRNATGGAINIVTNRPSTDSFSGGVNLEVGNYNLVKANGFLNAPVSDSFALRLAAQKTERDGYLDDGYNDDVSYSARLGALYKPSETFSLLLTGSYLHLGGKGPVHVPKGLNGFYDNDNPWKGLSNTIGNYLPVPMPAFTGAPADLWAGVNRADGRQDTTVKSLSAELKAHLGAVDLTVLANHMTNRNASRFYGPGFLVDNGSEGDKSTQNSIEARLAGSVSIVDWQAGLYHFDEQQKSHFWVDQGFIFNQTGVDMDRLKDDTNAAFTQWTFNVTNRLSLIAGLRYTEEKKSVSGNVYSRQPGPPAWAAVCPVNTTQVFLGSITAQIPQAATNGAGTAYPFAYCQDSLDNSVKWNDTSWKVGFDFDVSSDSMLYATVSRGFKSGGFFGGGIHSSVAQADGSLKAGNKFEPETLLAYAVGSKNRFLGQRLQLNAEAFFWNYQDHQENYLAPTSATGSFNFVTQNADAEIYGLDLETDALLSDNDRLGVKAQYLHAEYTRAQFVTASPGPGNASPWTVCNATHVDSGNNGFDGLHDPIWVSDCKGQQLPRSPELSATIDYSHTFMLGNGGSIVPGASLQYSASYWSAVDYNPLQKQDAYTTYGADLGYHAPNDVWSVTAYGANLGNEVVYTNAFMYPGNNSATGSVAMIQLAAPRTYGVRFNAKF